VGNNACAGQVCTGGCVGDGNKCVAVGAACGQASGNCNADGTCGMGMMVCGAVGQACCGIGTPPQGAFCSKSGTDCVGNGNNRMCVACGAMGQPCCGTGNQATCAQGTCMGTGGNRMCM
jgi:hypothetical protein